MLAHSTTANQYNQYKQQSAMTASPGELTLMLYDGCLKNLKISRTHIDGRDYLKANEASQKAQNILIELMRTLDMQYELSSQLMQLYGYILDTVIQSNLKKDVERIDTAVELLSEIRETWQQAVRLNRQQVFGQGSSV